MKLCSAGQESDSSDADYRAAAYFSRGVTGKARAGTMAVKAM